MNLKFSLTKETKIKFGITLHRIKAEKNFAGIKKNDLGGWVEKEENIYSSGNAWVSGDAQVSGNARVEKSPLLIQGTKHIVTECNGNIKIGCEIYSIKEWKKNYKEIGKKHGYTDNEIAEYYDYILLAEKRMIK